MTTYQLDTNVLLRYLTQDVLSQSKRVRSLMSLARRRVVSLQVCEPIFVETAVMLRNYYKYPRVTIYKLLSDLLNAPELDIEHRERLSKATALYHDTTIDFIDCILLICAGTQDQQVFSFDAKVTLLASSSEQSH